MTGEIDPKCSCARCRARGFVGPIILITVGTIFLLGRFTHYGFFKLWPVILIVAGIIMCFQFYASREGHIGS